MNEEIKNLERRSLIDSLKKNKTLFSFIIGIFILICLSLFSYNEYKKKKIEEISDNFNKALILIQKNKNEEASKILEKIIKTKNNFYSVSALNLVVENKLFKNKNKVIKNFDFVINKSNIDKETRNLVLFKKILFLGKEIDEKTLLDNLNPIIQSNSVWKNTVSNYIKKYYLSKKEYIKAKEFGSIN